jgi:RNA polymerase sigma factor (sigma-70 family)
MAVPVMRRSLEPDRGDRLVNVTPNEANSTAEGFEFAFPELFVRARRCSFRVLRNTEAAEDVAAETMARAYARWSKVCSYADAWVTRVAVNLSLDSVRSRSAVADTPRARPDRTVDRLVLQHELRKLPRRQREAIVLRYVLDLDEKETARILGVGIATVRTHVKRGLARVRAELRDDDAALLEEAQ